MPLVFTSLGKSVQFRAALHVKAVLTSLNTAFLPVYYLGTFQATLDLSAYFIDYTKNGRLIPTAKRGKEIKEP